MMGIKPDPRELFSYVHLEARIPSDHRLRQVKELVDFSFVRQEVSGRYGYNGHESVDPVVILKLMFLLFVDGVPALAGAAGGDGSERQRRGSEAGGKC